MRLEERTDEQAMSAVELRELRSIVADELSQLPARFRTTVAACDLEGRSQEEAAPFGGAGGERFKSRLTRGRARLRAGWHGEDSRRLFPALGGPLLCRAISLQLVERAATTLRSARCPGRFRRAWPLLRKEW